MRRTSFVLVFALCLTLASLAHAQVVQPNGLVTPLDSMNGETQLYTLFSSRGEAIDFVSDGAATPATFSPLCDFRATYVLNEAGSHFGLAWYNAVPGAATAPTGAELHLIVPGGSPIGTVITSADIRVDPSYLGGEIGFALVGGQTHYSEARWNPICTSCGAPGPWITAVMYRSTVTPDAYYVAFEDGDVTASSFNNDGDYNDDVFFLEGLVCAGGGERCDTGMPGICADGVSDCGGTTCRATVVPRGETCNGLDDDCNEMTDEGDLCPAGDVCDRGQCVHRCGGEFGCGLGLACDEARGFCVDELCVDVPCGAGEVCRAGTCMGACDGVVCPGVQVCRAGGCFDASVDVTCPAGQVCDEGGCVQSCECAGCGGGEACDVASGMCIDAGCIGVSCSAPSICRGGTCVDPCDGAVCPRGFTCAMGDCVPIPAPPDAGGSLVDAAGGDTDSGTGSGGMDAGGGSDVDAGRRRVPVEGGCGCSVPRQSASLPTGVAVLMLAVALVSRRRKR
jgi:MYXO-CTERM domain-containing protein